MTTSSLKVRSVLIILLAAAWLPLPLAPCFADNPSSSLADAETIAKAERGDANAQYQLGSTYNVGSIFGVPPDYAEAAKWYRKAAEQGVPEAQLNLGLMCNKGQGVPHDDVEAAKWIRKAAEQGDEAAQYNLGLMFYYGYGVTRDYDEAARWYRKAAEQGSADAQERLGLMYGGTTCCLPHDDVEAVKWFRKAATQGNQDAQLCLGGSYQAGKGVPLDPAEAMRWFRKISERRDTVMKY